MEKKLKNIFDYQRFEQNGKLEKLIHETESRCADELSDEDLFFVNAAGETAAGGVDWQLFGDKFHDAFVSGRIQPTAATKELMEAVKAKDWTSVAIKAVPFIAADPVIAMIFYECRN